jgi:hypothetical protein
MMRTKVLLAAALLVGSASACSDINGNNVAADGVYSLQEVQDNNGTAHVPYTFTDQFGHQIFVQSDIFVLSSNGTYSEQQNYTDNGFQHPSLNETGSWSQSGNVVFFSPSPGGDFGGLPYQGTVRNSSSFNGSRTLTISINGTTAIYSD